VFNANFFASTKLPQLFVAKNSRKMKRSGFVMVDKGCVNLFPVDRPFTEVEALVSLEITRNNGGVWSYAGYAKRWGWDRAKVRRFMEELSSEDGLSRVGYRKLPGNVHLISQNTPTVKGPSCEQDANTYANTLNPTNPGLREGMRTPMRTGCEHYYKTETKETTTICPERRSEPVVEAIRIPLEDDSFYDVTPEYIMQLQDSFPGLDVVQVLRTCRQWNIDNPKRRKTINGIRRHISGWISRQHEKRTSSVAPQKDCQICSYNQDPGEPCRNISKPGYPEKCQSFNLSMN
jgi:hypothetical protein